MPRLLALAAELYERIRTQKIAVSMLGILILATLTFIWGNSIESVSDSQEKSLGVLEVIWPLLESFVGKGNVTDRLVRKLPIHGVRCSGN